MAAPRFGIGPWRAAFLGCLLAAGAQSVATGLDVNWDLKNYHYYDAYAFLNDRLGWDVAPAMRQTYYNPLADLPFWFLNHAIPSPRITAFAMAAPAGVALFCLLRMAAALFARGTGERWLSIACAVAIGATGSMGLSVIGSTMNEWPSAMLIMIALAAIVTPPAQAPPRRLEAGAGGLSASTRALVIAGVLAGAAAGLKLTYAVFAVALLAALASFGSARERGRAIAIAGLAMAAGFVATYGFWGWTLWREFGNPFFPYFNDLFKSPWWEPIALFDRNFGPRDALQAIAFPLYFARDYKLVAEVSFRDWRLAALLVLALACAVRWLASGRRPMPPAWRVPAVFTLVSYLLWLKLFGIYRYLVPLEMLSGPLIVGAILYLGPGAKWVPGTIFPKWVPGTIFRRAAIGVVAVLLLGTTRTADWGRLPFHGTHFDVGVPSMEPGALVVMGPAQPMAYIIPFFPADARFVSPENNFLRIGQSNLLARRIVQLVASHRGPIYSLDFAAGGDVDAVLPHYGLRRVASRCNPVRSRLDTSAMQLCAVERVR